MTVYHLLGLFAATCTIIVAITLAREWLRDLLRDPNRNRLSKVKTALGLTGLPDILFLILAAIWTALAVVLVSHLFLMILSLSDMARATTPEGTHDPAPMRLTLLAIAALTTTAGAAVALPITLRRAALQHRQTNTAELALFNEKINAASADLHAMRQNNRYEEDGQLALSDGKVPTVIWEPDIVRRNTAIDALFGLALEQSSATGRIARMLSVYVRELSTTEAKPVKPPKDAAPAALREWARRLDLQRSDMQAAVQILGQLRTKVRKPLMEDADIDLSRANLQAMDLQGLCFDKAKLTGAQMQGANLLWAQMQGAHLGWAQMQGADLRWADLRWADLRWADLRWAEFDAKTDFTNARVHDAAVKSASFEQLPMTQDQNNSMFGDAGTPLPDGCTRPDHWHGKDLDEFEFCKAWRDWIKARPDP